MIEKQYETSCGMIHYWISREASHTSPSLVFLPGLTADHRLFEKQLAEFKGQYPLLVWDAPGHAASWPFDLTFSMLDKVEWLDDILYQEKIREPVIIGQSMGGYVGQAYAQVFPKKLKGLISIDSGPLQRNYITDAELCFLKNLEPFYRYYPWKALLKAGIRNVSESDYGRKLMYDMMMTYDGDQERYAKLSGHGFRLISEAIEADLPYRLQCPALLICGEKDHVGFCIRYNREWHRHTGIPIEWIKDAGHNANTDKPEIVNSLIADFISGMDLSLN